ncbi:hypothetical protein QQP08_017226 [Theobroma cacao]|nr:hypothetical protein QQP08_017226 [Theobroma cacao]
MECIRPSQLKSPKYLSEGQVIIMLEVTFIGHVFHQSRGNLVTTSHLFDYGINDFQIDKFLVDLLLVHPHDMQVETIS